ncbi:hypothetical protein [Haloechinothrix sp. LS1_15]|uniref:hypothetical protein n=1 Tax=Haloechinothrix sp. LS1_15 TaxID=2652248 RepID=UPI00294682F9|nr:hypothetical protein [Haloechinothrix sp. LS1_15]MDV6012341.1 hypothetical protein [Haloechinothrix sp. LS1_15]
MESRKDNVLEKLRSNETPTGQTQIQTRHMPGISDDMVKEIAAAAGYEWRGRAASRHDILQFQRTLTPSTSTIPEPPEHDTAMESYLASVLPTLHADARGFAYVDMTRYQGRRPSQDVWNTLQAHGWQLDSFDFRESMKGRDRRFYWQLRRSGSTTASAPDFVKGPGIEELSQYPEAQYAAAEAQHRFGVNPLSAEAANDARQQHSKLYSRMVRSSLLGTALLVPLIVLLTQFSEVFTDPASVSTGVLATMGTLTLAVALLAWRTTHLEVTRRRRTRDYTRAYEYVVSETFAARGLRDERSGEQPGDR